MCHFGIFGKKYQKYTMPEVELRFEKYDLVICDEFGYISFDKEGAELQLYHTQR